jgi:hypothetical protein
MSTDRGWYYLVEPDGGRHAPEGRRLPVGDGRVLTVRHHGSPGRVQVIDESRKLSVATMLRAARAVGERLPGPVRVRLDGGPARIDGDLHLDGAAVSAAPSPWIVDATVDGLLATGTPTPSP